MTDQITLNPNALHPTLANWLEARQSLLKVTVTTISPSGQTLDWVPIESQLTAQVATPPPVVDQAGAALPHVFTEAQALLAPQLRTDVQALVAPHGLTDAQALVAPHLVSDAQALVAPHLLDAQAVLAPHPTGVTFDIGEAGPAGHVPILRPDLTKLASTVTLADVLSKKGGLLVNMNRTNKKPTDPNPAGYFHASSAQWATVYGCDAWLNVWDPKIDVPSSPGDDHSISQTWLQNYHKPQLQSIEAGLTVDRNLNGDFTNHIFTYFTTNGYSADGNNIGGYNRLQNGWVQYHPSIYPGIRVNGSSTPGGGQLEIGIKFQLWQGNWWFAVNNNEAGPWIWIGYYPASLFGAGGIATQADWVSFGGEVFSALPNPCATQDQMGSGRHAALGWSHACYQRLMHNQTNMNGALANFNGATEVDTAASGCASDEFTIQPFMNSGSSWGSYQYFGGPSA